MIPILSILGYRVDDTKYRETSRVLNLGIVELTQFQNFVLALNLRLNDGQAILDDMAITVGTDCNTLSTQHHAIVGKDGAKLSDALESFRNFYHSSTYATVVSMHDTILSLRDDFTKEEKNYLYSRKGDLLFSQKNSNIRVDQVSMTIPNLTVQVDKGYSRVNISTDFHLWANYGFLQAAAAAVRLPDDQFWNRSTKIWVRFVTLRQAVQAVLSSLSTVLTVQIPELEAAINTIQDAGFAISSDMIRYLELILKRECLWCFNDDHDTFIDIVKQELLTVLTNVNTTVRMMKSDTEIIYRDVLVALTRDGNSLWNDVIDASFSKIIGRADNLNVIINNNMTSKLSEALDFASELLHHIEPKCSVVSSTTKGLRDNAFKARTILLDVSHK